MANLAHLVSLPQSLLLCIVSLTVCSHSTRAVPSGRLLFQGAQEMACFKVASELFSLTGDKWASQLVWNTPDFAQMKQVFGAHL